MRPSELQATRLTRSVWPASVSRSLLLDMSHSFTVPSQLALASVLLSGANASPSTQVLCPVSVHSHIGDSLACMSHSQMIPSTSLLASRRPSGLHATADTG